MYNRYIPQSDGSYRRNQMPEPSRQQPQRSQQQRSQQSRQPQQYAPPPQPRRDNEQPRQHPAPMQPQGFLSAGNFLRQLLPKDLGTEDLLIIILLMLMAGDREEDRNTALLTLALYLFM